MILIDAGLLPGYSPSISNGQVKNGCQDFCDGKEGVPRGKALRAEYGEEITLIAGHCDIHGGQETVISQWLNDALHGVASPEVVDTLAARSQRLRATIIDPEPWRMGMVPVGN